MPPTSSAPRRRYPLRRLLRANLYDLGLLLDESRLVLAGFGLVALVSTAYLGLFYRPGPGGERPGGLAEALYETLKLLTLQSGLAFPQDLPGQVIFFLTPLLGLALIFQSVLNFGRLLLDKGSRREAWQVSLASTYRDHVIVCGLGRLGMRVVDQLVVAGYEPVVVELDWGSEFVQRTLEARVPVVPGDAREPTTLRRAGVQRARALVAAVNDDMLNVEIALTARALRPDLRVILRIFNDELDEHLERSLGPNSAFSASALAAPTFAAAAISRDIDHVLPLDGVLLAVTQPATGPDVASAVAEARGLQVLHRPAPGLHAPGGGQATVIGTLPAIAALQGPGAPERAPGPAGDAAPTVIVCGLGKVGYRVVRQLHRLTPRPRIVVVRMGDGRAEFPQKISQLEGVTTVIGDARDIAVLRRAGLDQAYSVAALTSDDLLNLQIGLAARSHRPDMHIVLRTFSDALAEKLTDLVGIRTTYSTSALAAPTLAAAAVLGDVRHAFCAAGQLFSSASLMLHAAHPFAGRRVAEVRAAHGVLVIGLRRAGALAALPAPGTP
ncbi:MAG TPA: NAD(P)-binding protein, partial [Roseiflexaceae bacterium]|nr:NAD(P)-binding protein [Roseiflexaceae bacterium]